MFDLTGLNEAQKQAVLHDTGPLLLLAGPGSGKTFTITKRILYLIEEKKVPPEEILVITFTKDAALSMQARFRQTASCIYPVTFGTFHAVFYSILRQSKKLKQATLLNNSQKRHLLLPILQPFFKAYEDNGLLYLPQEADGVLGAIGLYKNTNDLHAGIARLPEWLKNGRKEEDEKRFLTLFKAYEAARGRMGGIDFDDMVFLCREYLAKDVGLRRYWQGRFSHILMDEFQDINPIQYETIKLLSKAPYNLFAVGDDDQSIYGFRGARPACLKQFVSDFQARQLLLDINYRSRAEIVEASLKVINQNTDRFVKELQAYHTVGKEAAASAAKGKASEAAAVEIIAYTEKLQQTRAILEALQNRDLTKDVAVLFRTNRSMQEFSAALLRAGVDFDMKEKSESLYAHFVVKDIFAYFLLAHHGDDRKLYLQIMHKPFRFLHREAFGGAGMDTLAQLEAYYKDYYDKVYSAKALQSIVRLKEQLRTLKGMKPALGVTYVCMAMGYERYLKKFAGAKQEAYAEWQEIISWLKEDAAQFEDFESWLCAKEDYEASLEGKTLSGIKKKGAEAEGSSTPVRLMSVHASKGLEFDTVYIPDCNEKTYPHGSMPDKETCEEERRIFYVGMTRAKEKLVLSFLTGTKERPKVMSRFLGPLVDKNRSP